MPQLHILVHNLPAFSHAVERPLELGRQQHEEPGPFAVVGPAEAPRLIIAAREDVSIGRRQLRVEVESPVRVRFTNLNQHIPIGIELGPTLQPGQAVSQHLPVLLRIGAVILRIDADSASEETEFQSLAEPTLIPGRTPPPLPVALPSLTASLRGHDASVLLTRFERLVDVLQLAATNREFAAQVADATRDLVELDHSAVVLREGDGWRVAAVSAGAPPSWQPSQSILNAAYREKRTFWKLPDRELGGSLLDVRSVVAAPIRNVAGEVIGAVYGDRQTAVGNRSAPIGKLEAQLVEVLACGVAGGLARLEQERSAIERRVQLERFVTPEVARQLEADPQMLVGRDAEVTLLFCDIAGFSRISERLSPQQTFGWINDVMETLSGCVMAHGGTLVDYVGDELIAMWGAPLPVPDHAAAACRAATDMIRSLTPLDEKWSKTLGEPVDVGIGINSGQVRVGNTGSQFKLKYGPLGSQVNIASRLQGATRFLQTRVLLSGATAIQLKDEFPIRRVCSVRLKNIDQPLELFELAVDPPAEWPQRVALYEEALRQWEAREVNGAITRLSQLIATHLDDGPALVLLSRAIESRSRDRGGYDTVWQLPSK